MAEELEEVIPIVAPPETPEPVSAVKPLKAKPEFFECDQDYKVFIDQD